MFEIILGIGAVLVLIIIVMIFRVYTLVNVVRGVDKERVSSNNKINAYLFMAFLIGGTALFFWYSYARYDEYVLPVASAHGVEYESIFWITTAVTVIVFILTHVLLFYFPFRYRFKKDAKALFYPDNTKLEIAWTIIPAIVLSILVFSGWRVWSDITDKAPDNAEVVEIMGYQFAWAVRYPGADNQLGNYDFRLIDADNQFGMDFTDRSSFDDFTPLQIHVPKGEPVLFKIRSRDVLHSVYVPHFRLKMDAVPGMPTRFWFTPTKTTAEMREELQDPEFNYELACAEVCGNAHFSMRYIIVVDEPEDYRAWYAEQQSWLSLNPDYLAKVPAELKELAVITSGLEEGQLENSEEVKASIK